MDDSELVCKKCSTKLPFGCDIPVDGCLVKNKGTKPKKQINQGDVYGPWRVLKCEGYLPSKPSFRKETRKSHEYFLCVCTNCNTEKSVRRSKLMSPGSKYCFACTPRNWEKRGRPSIPLVGTQSEYLTCISDNGSECKCICRCGNEILLPREHFRYLSYKNKKSLSPDAPLYTVSVARACSDCEKSRLLHLDRHKTLTGWYRTLSKSKHRVRISLEDALDILTKQDCQCAYSGVDINFNFGDRRIKTLRTASLDRIDSSKGYEKDNVQWVHKTVNFMKHRLSDARFREICNNVAKTHPTS